MRHKLGGARSKFMGRTYPRMKLAKRKQERLIDDDSCCTVPGPYESK